MRIELHPIMPRPEYSPTWQDWASRYINAFQVYLERTGRQLNLASEGYVSGATNATTAAPTAGTYSVGDFVRNSAPAEAGAGGSKYVIFGWVCTVSGTPGTWVECRFLTGN